MPTAELFAARAFRFPGHELAVLYDAHDVALPATLAVED